MKKIYLIASMACLSLAAKAQIYSNNFESKIPTGFVTATNNEFRAVQNGSSLIIDTRGHDEWSSVTYSINNGTEASTISISKADTIYVRAKATFKNTNNPVLGVGFQDVSGVGPNNESFNAAKRLTLTNEWQVLKFVVTDWNDTYGTSKKDMDSTQVAKIVFQTNNAFANYPSKNSLNQDINEAFNGTVYIDYVSIGSQPENGAWLDAVTTYEQSFNTDVTADITSAESFIVTSGNGELSIVSAGHDQWDAVEYTLKDNVIDLTTNPMIEFTANATLADGYTGNFGVMVVAENELGQRIETAGAYKFQSLSTNSSTIQVAFSSFKDAEGNAVDATRIAKLVVLINTGFASSNPQVNNLDQTISTAFEGTINIENIKLGEAVVANGINSNTFQAFSLYPNPTASTLIIDASLVGGNYTVVSSTGVVMQSGVVESTLAVDELQNGLYHLQISNNGSMYSTTFIKK